LNRTKRDGVKDALVAYLLTAALCFLSLAMPVAVVALPFVWAYALLRGGYLKGAAAILLGLGTICVIDILTPFLIAAAFLPVAFVAAYMIRNRKRFLHSVLACSGGSLLGLALAIGLLQLTTGMPVVDFSVKQFGDALALLDEYSLQAMYQMMRYPDILSGAITQAAVLSTPGAEAISIMQRIFADTLNQTLVSYIVIYSLLAGLLLCVIPRALVKRQGMEVAAVPEFSRFALPRFFWVGYLVSYLFAVIGADYGWQSFDTLAQTVYSAYAFVFIVQALAFMDYLYKSHNMRPGGRITLHTLSTLVLGQMLMWVGLFENIADLRARMEEGDDNE